MVIKNNFDLPYYAVIVQKYLLISYVGNLARPLSRLLNDIESQFWCLWVSTAIS